MIVIYSTQPDPLVRKAIATCLMTNKSFVIQTCSQPLAVELLDGAKEAQLLNISELVSSAWGQTNAEQTPSCEPVPFTIHQLAAKLKQLAEEGILRKPRYLQKFDWDAIGDLMEVSNKAWEDGEDLGEIQTELLQNSSDMFHEFVFPDRKLLIKQILECLSTAEALYHVCCSSLSMENIALRCKFRRLSHFSRVFTLHNSIPPTAIRQRIQAAHHQLAS